MEAGFFDIKRRKDGHWIKGLEVISREGYERFMSRNN